MEIFDAKSEVIKLKIQTQEIRKRPYKNRKSKLDKFTYEILSLYDEGATVSEIMRWLKSNKRINVAHSTIQRWLTRYGQKSTT